jgi:hypothetical protein
MNVYNAAFYVLLMATFAYPGPHCKEVGILCDTLLSSDKLKLKKLTKGALTKGVLSELNDFRKENDISWDICYQWIVQLKGEDDINLASLKVSLSRLDKKRAELKRNKEHSKLEELMSKQHFFHHNNIMQLNVRNLPSKRN